jgi:hypothetical protein
MIGQVMALAEKMFIKAGSQVPCVNLAADVELDDIHPWAANFDAASKMVLDGKSPSLFVFVERSQELTKLLPKLRKLWDKQINFWLFYPKAPHLATDLNRDKTWEIMLKQEMKGTRQVGIDKLWSCLYYKNA